MVQYRDSGSMTISTFFTTLGISIALVIIVIAFGVINDENN